MILRTRQLDSFCCGKRQAVGPLIFSPHPRPLSQRERGGFSQRQLAARLAAMATLACCMIVVGCGRGDSGPSRYDLSGKITFDGRPIVAGSIAIAPDTAAGNSGPGSFALVRDGNYETASGKGSVGGPHVLTIIGFDRLPGSGSADDPVKPLFSSYELEVDLPREDGTLDIDVPASAAK